MYRLIHFSSEEGEYVVLTDELDTDSAEWILPGYTPVSYTHLTLPTILLV